MSEDSNPDLAMMTLQLDAVKAELQTRNTAHADKEASDAARFLKIAKYVLAPIVAAIVGGGGFTGWKAVTAGQLAVDVERQNIVNDKVHEKLGGEVIDMRKQLVETTKYSEQQTSDILTAIETGKGKRTAKPQAIQDMEAEVEERAHKAEAKTLLEVTDAEIDAAMGAKK
jgi:hypothetical protein